MPVTPPNKKITRKRLLIYYPPNKRAIGLNAVLDLMSGMDVEIFVLTQEPEGQLHTDISHKIGREYCFGSTVAVSNGIGFYFRHALRLIHFCREHKIDWVFTHLQQGNLVSMVASLFLPKVRFIYFRHHFQYFKKFRLNYLRSNRNELIGEWVINKMAKMIVVPSTTVKEGMIRYENVHPAKVKLIPYIYNFNEYPNVNKRHVQDIRKRYHAGLLLLMSSRFIEAKRHRLVIEIVGKLVHHQGLDINLILLDEGPLKDEMEHLVEQLRLKERIFFAGFTQASLDYMAACDLLVHPSLSEASNSSVKEMGMLGKTAVVCRGVGDFDDYLKHGINGFCIDPLNTEAELEEVLIFAYHNKEQLNCMGSKLQKDVLEKFTPNPRILQLYKELIDE